MKEIKIVVVEDDLLHFAKMEMIITELGYTLTGHALSDVDTMRLFRASKPDLILMDIQIVGMLDGVSLASKLGRMADVPIIFTTSFTDPETIAKATEVEPQAYLIKPVEKDNLKAAVELAMYKHRRKVDATHSNLTIGEYPKQEVIQHESFFVKLVDRIERIKFNDVLFIESADEAKYLNIQTREDIFKLRSSLKQLIDKLPGNFVRVNSSQLINIDNIDNIIDSEGIVNMGNYKLVMSRKYKKEVIERLHFIN